MTPSRIAAPSLASAFKPPSPMPGSPWSKKQSSRTPLSAIPTLRNSARTYSAAPAARQSDAIHMMAMPNPAEEVKSVLRAIKGKLLAGVSPDDMLVALRDWDLYAAHFEAGGRRIWPSPVAAAGARPGYQAGDRRADRAAAAAASFPPARAAGCPAIAVH